MTSQHDARREAYIAQRLAEQEDSDNGLQVVPTVIGLGAIVVLFLGQPIMAAVMGGVAVLLSVASAGAAHAAAEVSVDAYMSGESEGSRMTKIGGIGCALLVIGAVLIIGMTVASIGLTLDNPWLLAGGAR